jgi:competence ComEA-like helix-hairpin-helix protein
MRRPVCNTVSQLQRLSRYLFTPSDRHFVGLVALCGAACLGGWLGLARIDGQGLVDIDQVAPQAPEFVLDLNAATWPELSQLPRIGEVLARRIISYRASHGPFRSMQELQNVHGIGPLTAERLRPFFPSLSDTEREDN